MYTIFYIRLNRNYNIYSGFNKLSAFNTSFQYLTGETGATKIILKSKSDLCSLA